MSEDQSGPNPVTQRAVNVGMPRWMIWAFAGKMILVVAIVAVVFWIANS